MRISNTKRWFSEICFELSYECKSHVSFILHSSKVTSETNDIVDEGVAHNIGNMADPENLSDGECQFLPFIRTMQRIVLYMTKSRIYIVGSNNMQTKFRVLKIDRTEPRALKISDDKQVYSQKEVKFSIFFSFSVDQNILHEVPEL